MSATQCHACTCRCCAIARALKQLGIDGDRLFYRLSADLARGLATEARQHVNFVDALLAAVNKTGGQK